MQKPLQFEINIKEFEELTRNIYNNQDNDAFKIIIKEETYDLKNAKNFAQKQLHLKPLKVRQKKL